MYKREEGAGAYKREREDEGMYLEDGYKREREREEEAAAAAAAAAAYKRERERERDVPTVSVLAMENGVRAAGMGGVSNVGMPLTVNGRKRKITMACNFCRCTCSLSRLPTHVSSWPPFGSS